MAPKFPPAGSTLSMFVPIWVGCSPRKRTSPAPRTKPCSRIARGRSVSVLIAIPPAQYHDTNFRHNEYLFAVARLRPGVTLQQANAYLDRKAQESIASEGSNSFGRATG